MKKKNTAEKKKTSTKQEKLFSNIYKTTQQFILGKGFIPLTQPQLIERLSIALQHQEIFQDVLNELEKKGIISYVNGKYIPQKKQSDIVIGDISIHPRGFGFVTPTDNEIKMQDIFIPKHLTQNAVDGDTVEVLINPQISDKGPEGRVVAIIKRARSHIAGIITNIDINSQAFAYIPMLGTSQKVKVEEGADQTLKGGDRYVFEVLAWGGKESATVCKAVHYLGNIEDPSCDNDAAIEEFELRKDFPIRALEEAKAVGDRVKSSDMKNRRDLRSLESFTIDPLTAKDFDDALSLSIDKDGIYHLSVHIADVSHYVQKDSELDKEAKFRCNSTYLPGFCLPMLPHELSNNLCSLKERVNRLTVTVTADFDAEGNLLKYEIFKSVINSAKRFTYEEALLVLQGKKKSKHKPTLDLMVTLCKLLKKKRYERGSLEFSLTDTVVQVDEKGEPYGIINVEYDITHQLVEEFMIKANEIVALHISDSGKHVAYRIHDEPSQENMKEFALLSAAFGFKIPEKPTPEDLQRLFNDALKTPYGLYLATCYIRRMRLAIYSAENIGHYGLNLTHYCHFTSPIRRYIDLVVHRVLFDQTEEEKHIEAIAKICSEQERISAKAENSVILLKKLRLLHKNKIADPYREYPAVVTRVKNYGIYFELIDYMLEGFLHVAQLDDDYYVFDEKENRLRGLRHHKTYACSNKITVMLKSVDFIFSESKWYLVPDKRTEKKKGKRFVETKVTEVPATKAKVKAKKKITASEGISKEKQEMKQPKKKASIKSKNKKETETKTTKSVPVSLPKQETEVKIQKKQTKDKKSTKPTKSAIKPTAKLETKPATKPATKQKSEKDAKTKEVKTINTKSKTSPKPTESIKIEKKPKSKTTKK